MERETDGVKKEEQFTFNTEDILTDPACEIIETKEEITNKKTSYGLKIADFAIDPDSCTILPESQGIQEQPRDFDKTSLIQSLQPELTNPNHLLVAADVERNMQMAKLYQVKYNQLSITILSKNIVLT